MGKRDKVSHIKYSTELREWEEWKPGDYRTYNILTGFLIYVLLENAVHLSDNFSYESKNLPLLLSTSK